jgi:hypothetical protein
MNEETRIYREYCWFALLLLILTVGFVGRPPAGETPPRAGPAGVAAAAATSAPRAQQMP